MALRAWGPGLAGIAEVAPTRPGKGFNFSTWATARPRATPLWRRFFCRCIRRRRRRGLPDAGSAPILMTVIMIQFVADTAVMPWGW